MIKIPAEHIPLVKKVVEAITSGQYQDLEISNPGESSIQDLKNAVESYSKTVGKPISFPPLQEYQEPQEVVDTLDEDPQGERMIFISFPLWFGGEKSDFCAQIELEEKGDGQWISRLSDVYVP